MAVSVRVSGGKAWKKALTPYVDNENAGVAVGALEGAIYAMGPLAGELVAENLARHEFGCEIEMPERTQTMYFKQNKAGTVDNRFVKKNKSNFSQEATVGAHTITIPARAPLRSTLAEKKADWVKEFVDTIKASRGNIKHAFNGVGQSMAKDIQQSFEDGLEPPLKEETVKRKKKMGYTAHASKPVMLTGETQKSIEHEWIEDMRTLK